MNSAAPFFTSWVYQQLPRLLTTDQMEMGGLKIRTSLNLSWQLKAQQIIQKQTPKQLQGAIVSTSANIHGERLLKTKKEVQGTFAGLTIVDGDIGTLSSSTPIQDMITNEWIRK